MQLKGISALAFMCNFYKGFFFEFSFAAFFLDLKNKLSCVERFMYRVIAKYICL